MAKSRESIIRTIKALLARGQHPSTPPAEAELAMKQAVKMMLTHAVGDDEVEGAGTTDRIKPGSEDINIHGSWARERSILLNAIMDVFGCKVIRVGRGSSAQDFKVVGFQSAIDMGWVLFESLDAQLLSDVNASNSFGKSYRRDFILSWTARVATRMRALYQEEAAESGRELVLASRGEEVERHFAELFPRTRTTSAAGYRHNSEGASRGAAADIFLSGARFDGGARALAS